MTAINSPPLCRGGRIFTDFAMCNCFSKNLGLGTAATKNVGTGTNQLPDMGTFAATKAVVGYQKLPSGLIIQWASADSTASQISGSVSLPTSFPSGIAFAIIGDRVEDGGVSAVSMAWNRPGSTKSSVAWVSTAAPGAFNVLAIGY
jgi:hypothetical protein